jgi:hypothetical protein
MEVGKMLLSNLDWAEQRFRQWIASTKSSGTARKGTIFLIGRSAAPCQLGADTKDRLPSFNNSKKNFWNIVSQGEIEAG